MTIFSTYVFSINREDQAQLVCDDVFGENRELLDVNMLS